ncbi:MAG: hypothetical protein EZS28_014814 [Streblomastix strix]|uniref:Right handed beta helix domain-containing protein n=1 Tax=Streblomastix strix TaxID=222440 RepID=A0A5J4W4T9_9EUKA|nr:MAG: hypothetical protein EZS28_014814 [Streblomastix strix]
MYLHGEFIDSKVIIQNNRFVRCSAKDAGAIILTTALSGKQSSLQIIDNWFISCCGSYYGAILLTQLGKKNISLNNNIFQDNERIRQSSNYGCDVSVIYTQFLMPNANWEQYCKSALQGSKSNKPQSVNYIHYQPDEDIYGFFNLRSISGNCWDSQYQSWSDYSECVCTAQGHPNYCTCPTNEPTYTQEQCQFDKLLVCFGYSEPTGGRKCSSDNYPSYCLCPLNNDNVSYTQTQCEHEKEIANTPIQ